MNKNHHKLIVIFIFTIILGMGFLYFSNGLNTEAAKVALTDNTLSSSAEENIESDQTQEMSDQIMTDTAFISSLIYLKNINIDNDFFSSASFSSLKDNVIILESVNPGRVNPFAPVVNNNQVSNLNNNQQ